MDIRPRYAPGRAQRKRFAGKHRQLRHRCRPGRGVGGGFRMSFMNLANGRSHSFGGQLVEMLPGERLRYGDEFEDTDLPGEMSVTVTFKEVSVGTGFSIEQAGIPGVIPAEACYLGWCESLGMLAALIEADIRAGT